jgi:enoyl-CoA hydratase
MDAAIPPVIVERAGDVLRVRIERAEKHNALSRACLAALGEAFAAHADAPGLKAAVLTGAGDKAFAAGGDLREFAGLRSDSEAKALFTSAHAALEQVRAFPVPVVAALNGLAVGGGAELALACDFRVAAPHAAIGYVQARLNISSGFGGGADLMRLLGPSRGLLLALRAETLAAAEAQAAGLVDEVAREGETLDGCVGRFLAPLLRQAPQVIRAWKAIALAERRRVDAAAAREVELDAFARTWVHADHWAAADKVLKRA